MGEHGAMSCTARVYVAGHSLQNIQQIISKFPNKQAPTPQAYRAWLLRLQASECSLNAFGSFLSFKPSFNFSPLNYLTFKIYFRVCLLGLLWETQMILFLFRFWWQRQRGRPGKCWKGGDEASGTLGKSQEGSSVFWCNLWNRYHSAK